MEQNTAHFSTLRVDVEVHLQAVRQASLGPPAARASVWDAHVGPRQLLQ